MAVLPRTPEIEKYIATLAKDPKSKVFAALAEAYRKAGALDEAVNVCRQGLHYNPNYMGGMVALGRSYFDKGMKAEAKEQLEKVIKITADNMIAQRILGEIYEGEGKKAEAVKAFKLILALNPKDAEVKEHLDILEGRKSSPSPPVQETQPAQPPAPVSSSAKMEVPPSPPPTPQTVKQEVSPVPPSAPEAHLRPGGSASGMKPRAEPHPQPQGERDKAAPTAAQADIKPQTAPPVQETAPTQAAPSGEGFEDFDEAFKDLSEEKKEKKEEAPLLEEGWVVVETTKTEEKEAPEGRPVIGEKPLIEEKPHGEEKPRAGIDLDDLLGGTKEEPPAPPPSPSPSLPITPPPSAQAQKSAMSTVTLAELYYKQGYHDKALSIYQALLSERPDDQELKDKVAMLHGLIEQKAPEKAEETISPVASRSQTPPPSQPPRMEASLERKTIDISVEENIRRLSSWLEKIKRGG